MAWDAGKLNKVTYTFAGGAVVVYASNFEYAGMALKNTFQLSASPKNAQFDGHNTTETKHRTLGALTSITYP